MKFTLSWLKEHLDTTATAEQIAEKLTAIGLELESLTFLAAGLESFTVAHILSTQPHPNADKLQICKVLTHTGERQIVCGAPNARAGINVILADIGDVIPANGLKIKAAKIREVESNGMLCSARELGIGQDDAGIMELDASAEVGAKAVDVLGLNDALFDISITPNRGDCLGVYGIARDLAAAGLGTLKPLPEATIPQQLPAALPVTIHTAQCSHFIAYEMTGVTNGKSPEWLKRRLESVGLRPISTLVDITNYFTIAYGRPLHVYDAKQLQGGITVRASAAGETLQALNDKSYVLPEGLCVIADDASMLGLGGVIGGIASGCTLETSHVILEAAWFDPIAIAHTGRALGIDSDARYRFERGVNPAGTAPLAALAASMIVELCGGQITAKTEAGAALSLSRTIKYSPDYVTERTGITVAEQEQQRILTALGCDVSADWQVITPDWRPDIEGREDIAEEIARIYGYEHLPETPLPHARLVLQEPSVTDKARDILLARGLDEVVHFAFTAEPYAALFKQDAPLIHVRNPISSELSVMRPHLLADMLPVVTKNQAHGHANLSLFEIGTVFYGVEPAQQPLRAVALRAGHSPLHWQGQKRYDVYDAKADMMALLEHLGVPTASLMLSTEAIPAWYHPGKAARLSLGPKNILGYVGEVHPSVLRQMDVSGSVVAFECWLDAVPAKGKGKRPQAYQAEEYPASRRDFAFVVDAGTQAGEIAAALGKVDKQLIRDITLFDVYQGKHLPEGKKSLAFAVTIQSSERTLTEADIAALSQKLITAAATKGAVLR